jgi:hypothetical protein
MPAATLFPSDANAGDAVGTRVAMNASGNRVVVGSLGHGHFGVHSGAAWVISNPGSTTQTEAELIPVGAFTDMRFASSLATNAAGDVVVVGAPGLGAAAGSPRVYVFRFNGSAWVEEWHATGAPSDGLGYSVATNAAGDVVASGAPYRSSANGIYYLIGGVDVYRHQTSGWVYETTVLPPDIDGNGYVGSVIALSSDGNLLALRSFAYGAPLTNGAVYLFEHIGGTWTQVARLQHAGGAFGNSIAIDGAAQTIALGSHIISIFRKGSSGWAFDTALSLSVPCVNCILGYSIAINAAGDRVLAGDPAYLNGTMGPGAVLEYERGTNGWQAGGVYYSPNMLNAAFFGRSLCIDATGRRWASGEPGSSLYGANAGLVQVFDSPCTTPVVYCTAKTNSLGCVPQIGWQGVPSASLSSGFTISVSNTRNQKYGLLFYGTNGSNAAPWLGGTLCVHAPLHRTPLQNSSGLPLPTNDCSGTFAFDFNAWTASGVDASLFAGQHVRAQYYSRDPGAGLQVNLTDAVDFLLDP